MKNIDIFKKEFKRDWYVQAGSAVPLFICLAGLSGFTMKKELGFAYSGFIYSAKKGYGEMWYAQSDLEKLWSIIKNKLRRNPGYLKQIKKKYEIIFRKHEKFFQEISNFDWDKANNREVLKIFKNCARAITDSVGLAHILEPIGLLIEKEFEEELAKAIPDRREFNQARVILTSPKEFSFVAREEEELKKIAAKPVKSQGQALSKHFQKYFWVHNSYAGQKKISQEYFKKRMRVMDKGKPQNQVNPLARKELIEKYILSGKIQDMAETIRLTTTWQDERKANALKTVGYLEKILDEMSKRLKIRKELFYYLGPSEISRLKSLGEINKFRGELICRPDGTFLILKGNRETLAIGQDYKKLIAYRQELIREKGGRVTEIRGSIANGGKVVGRVVVCGNVNSISKVKKGDILVASMTRPEYMPALRKAAAIITDEGGITSHAAIVARELNIPAIIGTKIATQVLKDGDLVEVRANHGVVKILKS